MSATRDRLQVVVNLIIVLVAAFVLFRPTGPATTWAREAFGTWQASRLIKHEWSSLANNAAHLGSGGQVALVMFTDYECPFCQRAEPVIAAFLDRHPEKSIVVRHYPLRAHQHARDAARLAICTEAPGAFPRVHEYFFEAMDWEAEGSIDVAKISTDIAISADELRECLASDYPDRRLRQDSTWAARLGLRGTPSFVGPRGDIAIGLPTAEVLDGMSDVESN